jgi:23S rRNA (uridine2552-2'-O)-methyltransferase
MKGKPDFYWRRSKRDGYPARSVYKLEEIQGKFSIIRPGSRVLDLGAAPGSWSIYLIEIVGANAVTGVDLDAPDGALLSRKGYAFIPGDFFSAEVMKRIEEAGPFDAVVSDAAPSTTGNRTTDTARSLEVGERVLFIAGRVLKVGGNLAMKIFQGGEERRILESMRGFFDSARAFKPKASRRDSMEIYFVGLGFGRRQGEMQ